MDELYDKFVKVYHEEIAKFLKVAKVAPKSRKSLRHVKKPYWNEDLSVLWDEFHQAEPKYIKMDRGEREYQSSRTDFLQKQKIFDKANKKARRSFQRRQIYDLEEANTNDPIAFWRHINSLGPRKSSGIPCEVWGDDGSIITNHDDVLNKWKKDFGSLLTPPSGTLNNRDYLKNTLNFQTWKESQ